MGAITAGDSMEYYYHGYHTLKHPAEWLALHPYSKNPSKPCKPVKVDTVLSNVAYAGALGKPVDWERLFSDAAVDMTVARSIQAATAVEYCNLQADGSFDSLKMKVRSFGCSYPGLKDNRNDRCSAYT